MPKITRKADTVYHGRDQGQRLTVHPDACVEVSAEKAEQLLRDFPDDWKKGGRRNTGNAPAQKGDDSKDDDSPPPASPYAALELDELRAAATDRGIEFTEETPVEALVEALGADDEARSN